MILRYLYNSTLCFQVDVINEDNSQVDAEVILEQLTAIVNYSSAPPSIARFTAGQRPVWSEIRDTLLAEGAGDAIGVMESALLVLSLENCPAPSVSHITSLRVIKALLKLYLIS